MQNVLLIGGGGFVGSHMAHNLSQGSDFAVSIVDTHDDKLRFKMANKPFDYRDMDIRYAVDEVDKLVERSDIVVNLAAYVHPNAFLRHPLQIVQTNLMSSLDTVAACVRHNKFLLHFSTSEVYGKTGGSSLPFREDESDCVLGPIGNHRWIYSCAKQMLDRIIHAHGLSNELNYVIVRPFNFVGPLMDGLISKWSQEDNPRVLANFMSDLIYGRPLSLVNGGHSKRSFTYIDDAVSALELIIRNRQLVNRQIINIGNPDNEITIAELANLIVKLYQRHCDSNVIAEIKSVPGDFFYGPGYEDCDRRLPEISKLKKLGWEPMHDLESTFTQCVKFYYDNRVQLETMVAKAL